MEQNQSIPVYVSPMYKELMDDFYKSYELEIYLESPHSKIRYGPQKERSCRFCGRAYSLQGAKFNKVAHIIPEFMGNKYLTNDFECDDCNQVFGRYENDLKNYLGAIPSLTKTKNKKNRTPKFISVGNEIIIAESKKIVGGHIEIQRGENNKGINFDPETGQTYIEMRKAPYVPFNVYKAFLKIGLSVLPKHHLQFYKNALNILNQNDGLFAAICSVHVIEFPLTRTSKAPFIYLFKRRNSKDRIPTHVIVMHYQNMIFQYYLPFHWSDGFVYKDNVRMPICPPMFSEKVDDIFFNSRIDDLTSIESKQNEIQYISYSSEMPQGNLFRYDPATGISEQVDNLPSQEEWAGVIIVPAGTTLPIKNR